MYSFFAMAGTDTARFAVAGIGSAIVTAILLASILMPSSPAATFLTAGVLA